jgi:hypothetical protein
MSDYREALHKLENIIIELLCESKKPNELYPRETHYEDYVEDIQKLFEDYEELALTIDTLKDVIELKCSETGEYLLTTCRFLTDKEYNIVNKVLKDFNQIALKPVIWDVAKPSTRCPKCGGGVIPAYKVCPYCAVKLDWSDLIE